MSRRRNKGSAGYSLGAGPKRAQAGKKKGCAVTAIGLLGGAAAAAYGLFEGAKAVLS